MAASMGFDGWLSEKLISMNEDVDLDVFVQYIRGILEDEEDKEERAESILAIISQITEDNLEDHCEDIQSTWWKLEEQQKEESKLQAEKEKLSYEEKMQNIMEEQKKSVKAAPTKTNSAVDYAQKQAILAQYSQVSDGEESDHGGEAENTDDANFAKNFNAQLVVAKQQQEREKSKAESDKKKAKDKEDREKQKAKVTDRKENEKKRTMKGEKRR